jgi:hypothetical protein
MIRAGRETTASSRAWASATALGAAARSSQVFGGARGCGSARAATCGTSAAPGGAPRAVPRTSTTVAVVTVAAEWLARNRHSPQSGECTGSQLLERSASTCARARVSSAASRASAKETPTGSANCSAADSRPTMCRQRWRRGMLKLMSTRPEGGVPPVWRGDRRPPRACTPAVAPASAGRSPRRR